MESAVPSIQYGALTEDFPFHEHACWEIHLFTSGRGALHQDGLSLPAEGGSLTFSPPHHGHSLSVSGPLSFYYMQFEEREGLLLRRLYERQRGAGALKVDPALVAEAARLKDKLDSSSPDRVAAGALGFRAWLYDLATGGSLSEPDGVDRALQWLRQNLAGKIELDDLASVADMDRFTFSRRFKTRTGLPPLAYVHRSKVEAAGFLLAGTAMPLSDVATRLGFCDEFHFSKVFKKWRGTTPGRWRRGNSAL